MNETIFIDDINSILQKCNSKVLDNNITDNNVSTINNNTPYALKSFQSMYGKFLYLKELNNKREEKKNVIPKKLIESFDDLIEKNKKDI